MEQGQSPRRRAAHASATATSSQQGPISQKVDEPDTLIIGDSIIKDITGKKIKTCYFPDGMVSDINQKLATIRLLCMQDLMIFKENSQNF
jgi:hypothetical protein